MLLSDYIFVTKQGLIELEQILENREGNYYRNRKVSTEEHIAEWKVKRQDRFERDIMLPILSNEPIEGYADDKPLELQSETLRQYIDDLRKLQAKSME